MADFLEEFVQQGMPLDDMIIGTLNTIDPLLDPAGICDQECIRYLKGITPEDIARIRREILDTTNQELGGLVGVIREYIEILCSRRCEIVQGKATECRSRSRSGRK